MALALKERSTAFAGIGPKGGPSGPSYVADVLTAAP